MAFHPASPLRLGQSGQDPVAADTFTMRDEDWRLPAFHEEWAPLGEQVPGTPHSSEASGCVTQREERLGAQVEALLDLNYRLQRKLARKQNDWNPDYGALLIMVTNLDQRMEKLQQGIESFPLSQHVQASLRTKDAEIERLKKDNEEYHFICNMATEHDASGEVKGLDLA